MNAELTPDRLARMAISCVIEGGDLPVAELVAAVGPEQAWTDILADRLGEPMGRRAAQVDLDQLRNRADKLDLRFLVPGDEEWPTGVDDLEHSEPVQRRGGVPVGLWVRGSGHLATMTRRAVAIVGSRASSSYGDGVAADLAAELAEQQVTIVSGGAYGIDAAAHRGALAVKGATIAVLACGVDVPYPRGNAALFNWIAKDHLLVSELPPGTTPTRMRFLARNRLIAALSQGTIVVEAALRSGARNTATWANECQRQLMAVPGPVHSTLSVTPHVLIREQRATLVTNAADVLEVTSPAGDQLLTYVPAQQRPLDLLAPTGLAVFEALPVRGGRQVDEIAMTAGVSIGVCLSELASLESAGLIVAAGHGWRVKS